MSQAKKTSQQMVDEWVRAWRQPMVRFARLHLPSPDDAEDVVQDCFEAALTGALEAANDPRRYLFGMLRHKVTDRLRRRYREGQIKDAPDTEDLDQILFDPRGLWATGMAPAAWSAPEGSLESDQFFRVVDICVNDLPAKPARVFSMKELLELAPREICDTLGITQADYWQSLSRARKQIHLCLNQRWFGGRTL